VIKIVVNYFLINLAKEAKGAEEAKGAIQTAALRLCAGKFGGFKTLEYQRGKDVERMKGARDERSKREINTFPAGESNFAALRRCAKNIGLFCAHSNLIR
jgi:hypothetical protein